MNLFVEMFMVQTSSGGQRKAEARQYFGSWYDGNVRISQSAYAPHDWLVRSRVEVRGVDQ